MNFLKYKILTIGLFIGGYSLVQAQMFINSPYSISGLGLLHQDAFHSQRMMGGLNTAIDSSSTFSFANPASLSNSRFTNLEVGAGFTTVSQETATQKGDYNTGQFDYVALAIPLSAKRKMAMAFGLNPYSRVDYFIQNYGREQGDSFNSTFEGRGGVNQFRFAYGMTLYKGWSLGYTASSFFGNTRNNTDKQYVKTANKYSFRTFTTNYHSGFSHRVGVQYNSHSAQRIRHTFGASYGLQSKMEVNSDKIVRTYNSAGNYFIDTVLNRTDAPRTLDMPYSYSVGYGLGDGKHWHLGLQYTFASWSDFTDLNNQGNYFDQTTYGVGGYFQLNSFKEFESYQGKKDKSKNYFKIVRLYYGLSYSNLYMNSFSEQVSELGINLGVGLPIIKPTYIDENKKIGIVSSVNVGIGYTHRGKTENGLIQEQLFQIRVATSFNDKWFTKRKYL